MDASMLIKGQLTPITDGDNQPIVDFVAAAGWDAESEDEKADKKRRFSFKKKSKKELGVDLDLSAVVLNADGDPTNLCWQSGLKIYGGALVHGGDNTTGEGDGPDEEITMSLGNLDADLVAIVPVLAAYTKGVSFKNVGSAFWQIFGITDGQQHSIAKVNLSIDKSERALAFAVIVREGNGWSAKSIKRYGMGSTKEEVMALAKTAYAEYLRGIAA